MTAARIITEPLGGSALSRLLQSDAAPAEWLPRAPRSPDGWRAIAERRRTERDWSTGLRELAPAFGAEGRAAEQLERVIAAGGVLVTTGQQPGLFGGPIYTWSKAVGAMALASTLERATGIPTIAVYWAATDDADFAESATTIVARRGGAQLLRATDAPPAGTPMSLAPLGALDVALRGLRDACGSAPDPRALEAALEAYGDPSRTVGDAFVLLLRALLAPLGMPVLDASHHAVRDASAEVLGMARSKAAEVERALAARTTEIRAAGYEPQVDDVAGLSLVFAREGTTKARLAVASAASHRGATYTPNVLLRPIVERAILPTVAYVAGPGELAYFAQVSAVARALGTEPPVAVPRWSCTIVEPAIDALLDSLGVAVEDLSVPDTLETRLARGAMSEASARALEAVRATIETLPASLGAEARELGLTAALQGAMHSLQHRVDRLERRLVAGVKRREASLMQDVGTLRGVLYPFGKRQERALNLIPLLARNGLSLLESMREAASGHAAAIVGR